MSGCLKSGALATAGVQVSLRSNAIFDDGFGNFGTILNIENVDGSLLDDFIQGNDAVNMLNGRDGADLLFGYGGGDILNGGAGDDQLRGGKGGALAFEQLLGVGGRQTRLKRERMMNQRHQRHAPRDLLRFRRQRAERQSVDHDRHAFRQRLKPRQRNRALLGGGMRKPVAQ